LITAVGGFEIGEKWTIFGFRLKGEREMIKDSLLSWAGTKDPISGKTWGGVTRNGGRLDMSFDDAPVLYYLYGGYDFLMGASVKFNHAWNAGLGIQWTLYDSGDMSWVTGLSGNSMGYLYNLRYFSLGHGGYFSPQLFVSGAVPVIFKGEKGRLRWNLQADVGVNWFKESDADYYPTSTNGQAQRATMTDPETGDLLESIYAGSSKLSFALNLDAGLAYQIIPSLAAWLNLALHTAKDYREFIGGVFLQYTFGQANQNVESPVDSIGDGAPPPGLLN
jgi:hypothetical protein